MSALDDTVKYYEESVYGLPGEPTEELKKLRDELKFFRDDEKETRVYMNYFSIYGDGNMYDFAKKWFSKHPEKKP